MEKLFDYNFQSITRHNLKCMRIWLTCTKSPIGRRIITKLLGMNQVGKHY